MPDPTCQVASCRPYPCPDNAAVCAGCARRLRNDLAQVPEVAEALVDAMARLVAMSSSRERGPRSSERPLPVDLKAGGVLATLLATLRRQADWIAGQRGYARPLDTPVALSGFLTEQVEWLRHRPEGPRVVDDVHQVVRAGLRKVDRPVPRWYAGPCGGHYLDDDGLLTECTADVYVRSGEQQHQCRRCKQVLDVPARQEWLQQLAEDQLVNAAMGARMASLIGEPTTSAQVRGWAARGRLVARVDHGDGHPLYRLGDVIELAIEQVTRRAETTRSSRAKGA